MKSTLLGAAAYLASVMPSLAADIEPAPQPAGGVFGYISGGYYFEDALKDWRLFDLGEGLVTSKESFGDGWGTQGRLGFRWSEWDVAIGGQYADFGAGGTSVEPGADATTGDLRADMWSLDAQVGFNTLWGETALRAALGVRYAEWHNEGNTSNPGEINHDWWGIGPRLEISTETPLSENLSLLLDGGIAVLFGKIESDASSGGWDCDFCSDENTTSLNADGRLGLGWSLSPGVKLVAGYQVQYWSDVNVAVSDTTGSGGSNVGTSDHLIHGPFGSLNFDLSR